jgi:hypothetical protein
MIGPFLDFFKSSKKLSNIKMESLNSSKPTLCPDSIRARRFLSRVPFQNEFRFISYNILSPYLVKTEEIYIGADPSIFDWSRRRPMIEMYESLFVQK